MVPCCSKDYSFAARISSVLDDDFPPQGDALTIGVQNVFGRPVFFCSLYGFVFLLLLFLTIIRLFSLSLYALMSPA